jgi:hypothetical protein
MTYPKRSVPPTPPDAWSGKYAPLVPILRDLIARPDTPLDAAAKEHILAQLDRAEGRFAAVLPPGDR